MANKWIVAISVTTGAMMAAVDTSVLNIATPHLRGVFSATTSEISWISTGYLLTVVMGMPLTGWLCKHFDRKKVCQGGLFVFIIASMLCYFSTDLNSLILARVLQGIGAGILLPVEQVILRQTFPPKEQGLAMGIYGVTIMIGPAIGPLLGGLIIDHSHWSLIFFINIPIGIAGLLMIERFVPEMPVEASTKSTGNKPDMAGIALLATALFPLLYLLERGDRLDWFETKSNVILLLVFISAITMFCAHELMALKPAVQLRILVNRAFSSAMLMSFMLGIVVAATLFVLPIFMQDVLGYSATDAGMALVPRAIAMMATFPLVGILYNYLPARLLIAIGLLIGFYSAVLMTRFTHEAGMMDVIWPQILQGISISLILTPLSTYALQQVQPNELPAAAGLNAFSRQLGSTLGIAVFASLLSHFELFVRGTLIHHMNWSDPVLRDRFSNVILFFYKNNIVDNSVALQQGFNRLNDRFMEQVIVLSYQKTFEWVAVAFVVMIFCLLIMPIRKRHISS